MSARIQLRVAAQLDIDEQAEYLAVHASLSVALRYRDAIQQSAQTLAQQPDLGARFRASSARLEGVRFWPVRGFGQHVIFYQQVEGAIEIVRVLHGRRDIEAILD